MSKIFNWKENIKEEELQEVEETLKNGGIVIFPTDTVYGIGCNCFSTKAIKKIFDVKSRSEKKPINVLTDKIEKIENVTKNIKNEEKEIINKYMPGAVTVVLDKNENVPDILTSGLNTIGVRIPDNKIALEILKKFENPLATTSVNISGDLPGVEISDFVKEFENKVDIIIDGGKTKIGVASTIVKVDESSKINILREGSIKI
ncbi:MAG: threonylcarbamoyl-AMP synthase [Clostridia bacterium]|nr:threonylcarbamoyl-AMP synthase [Clostridia bacterium]